MLAREVLDEISKRISTQLNPDQIILFGSHAWGTPTEESDVDLLIIVPDSAEAAHKRAVRVHRALRGLPLACDVIVRTRAEIAQLNPVRSSLLYRALTEGRPLDA